MKELDVIVKISSLDSRKDEPGSQTDRENEYSHELEFSVVNPDSGDMHTTLKIKFDDVRRARGIFGKDSENVEFEFVIGDKFAKMLGDRFEFSDDKNNSFGIILEEDHTVKFGFHTEYYVSQGLGEHRIMAMFSHVFPFQMNL